MPKEYDLHGPGILENPYPLYHKLRSTYPVHLDSHLGCWVVTSYTDVVAALANKDLSSERAVQGALLKEEGWTALSPLSTHISNLMFFSDPPKHTRLRAPINNAFAAHFIGKWRGYIQKNVDGLLDLVQDKGSMDVIKDLALPLPSRVISTMLSIPERDHLQVKLWADDLIDYLGNPYSLDQCRRVWKSMQAFMQYFRGIVAEHRGQAKEDLVDIFLHDQDQETSLTEEELLMNCVGLFTGGQETTVNVIGNATLALLRHPEQMQKLQENPGLIGSAVEEFLRYDSPIQFTARIIKKTTEIRGVKMYKGQNVLLMLGAANRDPSCFPDPDTLDICRKNNRHLAFGHNIHYCIGASVARLEIQIALATLLRRMPRLRLASHELKWQENLSFHGVKALPVTF